MTPNQRGPREPMGPQGQGPQGPRGPRASETLMYLVVGLLLVLTGSCVSYVGIQQESNAVSPILGAVVMVGGLILMIWTRISARRRRK